MSSGVLGQTILTYSALEVYQVPTGKIAAITINILNQSTTTDYTVSVSVGPINLLSSPGSEHRITSNEEVSNGTTTQITGLLLNAGDYIIIQSGCNTDDLIANVWGFEDDE